MRRAIPFCVATILATVVGSAAAQPRGGPGSARFPTVGSQLPAVKAFDADGKAFSTASLRGRYTVIVFGCLT